jgi:hypothetical protein
VTIRRLATREAFAREPCSAQPIDDKAKSAIRITFVMELKVVFDSNLVQSRGSMALTTRATISSIVALSKVSMNRAEPARTRAAMSKLRT